MSSIEKVAQKTKDIAQQTNEIASNTKQKSQQMLQDLDTKEF